MILTFGFYFFYVWGLVIPTFLGLVFLRLGVNNSFVWGLVSLRLKVSASYVWVQVFLR